MLLLLLMVVGAGVGTLIYYAIRVPALANELNAWLGRPAAVPTGSPARAAQITFILFVYTAPLGLGLLVYFLNAGINWLDRRRPRHAETDDPFRIE